MLRLLAFILLTIPWIPAAESPWQATAVFLTPQRLATLKARIAAKQEPTVSAYRELLATADAALGAKPVIPPEFRSYSPYKEAAKAAQAAKETSWSKDNQNLYHLALVYRLSGQERYAVAAAALMDAWVTGIQSISKESNTPLSVSAGFPSLIAAADLLRPSPAFSPEAQERVAVFLRTKVVPRHSMGRTNNWGSWGTLLVMSAGAYLQDRKLFDQGVARWKALIDIQQDEQGTLHEEVTRSEGKMGLWYTNFTLLPATCAAEVARINGVDLFTWVSPKGKSLRTAHVRAMPWLQDPTSFPYFKGNTKDLVGVYHFPHLEILSLRYPDPAVRAFFLAHRPVKTHYNMPDLYLTHGDVLEDGG